MNPMPTPGTSVAGVQASGIPSLPAQGTLATGVTLNGAPFQAGQAVTVLNVPVGFMLPQQGGSVMLPAGSVVTITGRPELGQFTLSRSTTVNLATQPGSLAMPLGAPVNAVVTSGLSIGALALPPGAQIMITGLPAGTALPQATDLWTLPMGSTIAIPGRPELGQFTLSAPVAVDLMPGPAAVASLPAALPGVLVTGVNVGSMNLPAGAHIMVVGLPSGINVPSPLGTMNLPPGATIQIAGRPDLGTLTLGQPITVDLAIPGPPPAGAPPMSGGTPLSPSGAPTLAGQGMLAGAFSIGSAQLAAGEAIDILNVPTGTVLPSTGTITLPAGTLVGIPSRPELGAISLSSPIEVNLMSRPAAPGGAGPVMLAVPASAVLSSGITIGSTQLPSGVQLEIVGTPPGFALPPAAGPVTLPPGTIVRFPDRSEMGTIVLSLPVRVDLSMAPPSAIPVLPPSMDLPGIPAPIPALPPIEDLPSPVIPLVPPQDLAPSVIPSIPDLPLVPIEAPAPSIVPSAPPQSDVTLTQGPAPVQVPRR
jgi:hypothetical protein